MSKMDLLVGSLLSRITEFQIQTQDEIFLRQCDEFRRCIVEKSEALQPTKNPLQKRARVQQQKHSMEEEGR